MTKPTEEQIKALKPGDRVLVEVTVQHFDDQGDLQVTLVTYDGTEYSVWPAAAAIHSILPCEIKVGDRVRCAGGRIVWEVMSEPRAGRVSLWCEGYGFSSAFVDKIEVIS